MIYIQTKKTEDDNIMQEIISYFNFDRRYLTELIIHNNMQSLKNLQMCNYYLLRIINIITNLKNIKTPTENKASDLVFLQKKKNLNNLS